MTDSVRGLGEDVFDDGPCGLLCAAPDRRITAVNRTLARWLGLAPENLIGRRFPEFFSGGGRIHYETHVALLLEVDGQVAEWAVDLLTADGSRMPVLITADRKPVDVHLASGGHPPALLLTADGTAFEVTAIGGQAVGIVEDPRFAATHLHLKPGDTLLLYTDRLTEARIGPGPRRFDHDGALLDFARRTASASPSELIAALDRLLDSLGAGVEDDVALPAIGAGKRSGQA